MVTFAQFIEEHRATPWPGRPRPEQATVKASHLYEVYKAAIAGGGPDTRVLSHVEFGAALAKAGFTKVREADGHYWENMSARTRAERARSAVIPDVVGDSITAAREDHRQRKHLDGGWCQTFMRDVGRCDMPLAVIERIVAESAGAEAAIAAQVEERYGAFLRWRPGDPDPNDAIEAARRENDLAALRAELAALEADQGSIVPVPPALRALRERLAALEDEPRRRAAMAASLRAFFGQNQIADQGDW